MGRVLTYDLEGDVSRKFLEMRMKGVEDHLVFNGDDAEGEFCKRFPQTCMEVRGLYSIEDMFSELIESSRDMSK